MAEYLQTTFIEIAARYEAGEDDYSVYENLTFAWTTHHQGYQEHGVQAAKSRFDRRARRFFHPFTSIKTMRGLEVTNPNHIFDANVLGQLRLQHPGSVHPFQVEMAARLFFMVVHPLNITNANVDIYPGQYRVGGYMDVYLSPRVNQSPSVNQNIPGDDIMRPDRTAPLTQDAIVFLREFIAKMAAAGIKKRRAYGRSELGLFPLEYEQEAVKLYQQMLRHAVDGHRYVGVCGCDQNYNMSWLEFDLNPTRKEGTLTDAIDDYEHDSDEEVEEE